MINTVSRKTLLILISIAILMLLIFIFVFILLGFNNISGFLGSRERIGYSKPSVKIINSPLSFDTCPNAIAL